MGLKLSHQGVKMQLPTHNNLYLFYTLIVNPFPVDIKVLTGGALVYDIPKLILDIQNEK
jgi:hypothetical protein